MRKAELQHQVIALIKQLSTEELEMVVELLTDIQKRQTGDAAHPIDPDVEIAIKKIKKRYDWAWKTLAKV